MGTLDAGGRGITESNDVDEDEDEDEGSEIEAVSPISDLIVIQEDSSEFVFLLVKFKNLLSSLLLLLLLLLLLPTVEIKADITCDFTAGTFSGPLISRGVKTGGGGGGGWMIEEELECIGTRSGGGGINIMEEREELEGGRADVTEEDVAAC